MYCIYFILINIYIQYNVYIVQLLQLIAYYYIMYGRDVDIYLIYRYYIYIIIELIERLYAVLKSSAAHWSCRL